jgi:hypothetical protein
MYQLNCWVTECPASTRPAPNAPTTATPLAEELGRARQNDPDLLLIGRPLYRRAIFASVKQI